MVAVAEAGGVDADTAQAIFAKTREEAQGASNGRDWNLVVTHTAFVAINLAAIAAPTD